MIRSRNRIKQHEISVAQFTLVLFNVEAAGCGHSYLEHARECEAAVGAPSEILMLGRPINTGHKRWGGVGNW